MEVIKNFKHKTIKVTEDNSSELSKEEIRRCSLLETRTIKCAMDNLRKALRLEVSRGETFAKNMILTPKQYLGKAFVRISLLNLYRRYRNIRIQALTEALVVVHNGKTKEENIKGIQKLISLCAKAHVESKDKEKESKCVAF